MNNNEKTEIANYNIDICMRLDYIYNYKQRRLIPEMLLNGQGETKRNAVVQETTAEHKRIFLFCVQCLHPFKGRGMHGALLGNKSGVRGLRSGLSEQI